MMIWQSYSVVACRTSYINDLTMRKVPWHLFVKTVDDILGYLWTPERLLVVQPNAALDIKLDVHLACD